MKITSVHNKKILSLRKLYKNRERKDADVFLAEGVKEVSRGITSGFLLESVYFCPELFHGDIGELVKNIGKELKVYELDKSVYSKVAYRDNTEGILALFRKKTYSLGSFKVEDDSLFIILEAVEKPGNLGAILRTADAAGVSAIILADSKVDQYHPNVIRSSIGAAFNVPVIIANNIEVINWLEENSIKSFAAALPAYDDLYALELKGKIALVFGTESDGLSDEWLKSADKTFTIPMKGIVDSLNVSVSVAVSIYEAVRQRN